jgi:hypothetical protein
MLFASILLCLTTHFRPTLATSPNSTHASPPGSCKLRSYWRNHLDPSSFIPTDDFNFCAADPDVVSAYINTSLSPLSLNNRPRPCEVRAWYYGNYGGKLKVPFCQNATEIAVRVDRSHNSTWAGAQPYNTVIHRARASCSLKFKADLQAIGDPDLAGPGVRFEFPQTRTTYR